MGYRIRQTVHQMIPGLDISSPQAYVLETLADFANDATRACFPSHARLARQTKLSLTTTKNALKALRRKELIDWSRSHRNVNFYTFPFLPPVDSTAPVKEGQSRSLVTNLSDEAKAEIDCLATDLVRLSNNPANRVRDYNTFHKNIRERDFGSCQEVFHYAESMIRQGEWKNPGIGAMITKELQKIPLKVINSLRPTLTEAGREPTIP